MSPEHPLVLKVLIEILRLSEDIKNTLNQFTDIVDTVERINDAQYSYCLARCTAPYRVEAQRREIITRLSRQFWIDFCKGTALVDEIKFNQSPLTRKVCRNMKDCLWTIAPPVYSFIQNFFNTVFMLRFSSPNYK